MFARVPAPAKAWKLSLTNPTEYMEGECDQLTPCSVSGPDIPVALEEHTDYPISV